MDNSIKVCHITSAHKSNDTRIFYKECVSLANAGYDVYEVAKGESYEKNNVKIVGFGSPSPSRIKRMIFDSKKAYKTALSLDCDIYHIHDPELLPYALKLKRKGKKVIFDSHENTVEQIKEKEWIPNIIRKPMYFLFDKYQKYVCKRIDAIVSVTPHICDYFEIINNNTFMITNYPVLETPMTENRRKIGTVCFAGGISKQWNHEKIIEAVCKIPNAVYVLCGKAGGQYFEDLKSLNGWEKVNYKGSVSHELVNEILSECQIGMSVLSYSHNTGFKTGTLGNTKIFEEMMAGLPVVCTDFDLWKEFVEEYNCGICVNPDSTDDIFNAIKYLIDNPDVAEEMGQNGRKAVEEKFNWGIEEIKLLNLYKNI